MIRFLTKPHYRLFTILLAAAGCLLTASPRASAASLPASTQTALAHMIDAQIGQPRFVAASWGIDVVSLDSGHTLYAHRPDQLLQPASTAKLFTAALSLSTLGAEFHIPTRVMANDVSHDGRLKGPLILYGMGDPTLGTPTSADWARQLASQLSQRGIRQIKGDLIADDSYFTGPAFGSGWEAGDLQSSFVVPSP
jgi:D-alanyl-D-alanine carboxypeptidase/D-alanyl-D-alanine-endopeptidase (penicillin-binding protein 4)